MEFVEEAADVGLLRCELRACVGDDGGVEAEARGDVDAGGCAGDAETEFVGGCEGCLVEADGGVEHAGVARGVDLERGEVRGDDAAGLWRSRKCCATATARAAPSSGSVAEPSSSMRTRESFVGTFVNDAIEVADVRGEGGEVLLDGLRVADVGEDAGEDWQACGLGWYGDAGLGHDREQADGLERDRFAAGVGAADDHLALAFGERDGHRHDVSGVWSARRSSSNGWRAATISNSVSVA